MWNFFEKDLSKFRDFFQNVLAAESLLLGEPLGVNVQLRCQYLFMSHIG